MKMIRLAVTVLMFSGLLAAQSSGPNQGGISVKGVLTSGNCVKAAGPSQIQDSGGACGGGGSGTVTTFSAGTLSPLFTTSVGTPTSTPALSFSLTNAAAGSLFGNSSGSPAAPSFTLTPVLGLAGTSVGTLGFQNATSGTITLSPVTGALGTVTISLPAAAGTVAVSATSPVTESAAGAIACATCAIGPGSSTANHAANFSGSDGVTLTDSKVVLTPPATLSTLTIADGKTLTVSNGGTIAGGDAWNLAIAAGKTLTVSNTLTLSGSDGQSWAFPSGNGTFVGTGNTQNLSLKTLTSPILATLVTDTSMGSTTAAMTAQSSATCTNVTGMTWAIAASKNYRLQCMIPRTLAASATMQYCLGGPGTPTSYTISVKGLNGASSAFSQVDTLANGTYGTKTTASSANANNAVDEITAFIQNGSTASGTALTLQTAGNGTNNITVGANAWCDLKQVN